MRKEQGILVGEAPGGEPELGLRATKKSWLSCLFEWKRSQEEDTQGKQNLPGQARGCSAVAVATNVLFFSCSRLHLLLFPSWTSSNSLSGMSHSENKYLKFTYVHATAREGASSKVTQHLQILREKKKNCYRRWNIVYDYFIRCFISDIRDLTSSVERPRIYSIT